MGGRGEGEQRKGVTMVAAPEEKVVLSRGLCRGREDGGARLFESKGACKSGW